MKKTLLSVLFITIFVQILIPSYMIWGKYDVLKNGEEVKIKVAPIDPYDAFRGRYVSLWYDNDLSYEQRQGKYGILEIDEEGFATVKKVEKEQPKGELYLTSQNEDYFYIPLDRYYMEEKLAPKAEEMISGEKEAYVTIRIKGDKSVLSGLYIDGKPVEEILTESDD